MRVLGTSLLFTSLSCKVRELSCWALAAEELGDKTTSRGHGKHSTSHPALPLLLIARE